MATTKTTPKPLDRPLSTIAREIRNDYRRAGRPLYFGAVPYVEALESLNTRDLGAHYGQDSAESLVRYLLGNLTTWRGDVARSVKADLKAALADHTLQTARAAVNRARQRGEDPRF